MAREGDTFTLHDGETVTIKTLSADLLAVDAEWSRVEGKPPAHRHPRQDERFEVSAGELTVRLNGREHVLRAGDSLDVPRNAVHSMWSSGSEPSCASWQVRPALRTAEFFEYVHQLRAAGHTGKGGAIDTLAGGLVLREFSDEFSLPLPAVVQKPVAALLSALARLCGYPTPGGHSADSAPAPRTTGSLG